MQHVSELIERARAAGRRSLSEADGKRLLSEFGIVVPEFAVVDDVSRVDAALDGMRGPFAVKVMSRDILHKSDAGGVVLDAPDHDAVRKAIADIASKPQVRGARIDGYLVERMCLPGREIVVGAVSDPQFGLMLMVGLGGIFVELLQDVAFRLCPIDRDDAKSMLAELRAQKIFDGVRGERGVDRDVLAEFLLKVGGKDGVLASLGADIAELDLNPVIVRDSKATVADARMLLTEAHAVVGGVVTQAQAVEAPPVERFMPLFAPRTVAVIGASATTTTMANTFIRRLREFGYTGAVYPIHPKAETIEGLACYRSLDDAPDAVDYAYIAVAAASIPAILREAHGRLRYAQVISSGFGETPEGAALQDELVRAAQQGGCRLLGPNCLGVYSPRGGVTFPSGAPRELGTVGVVTQSGGLGTDIIKRGQWRGIRFSGLVTIGNSADVGPAELLEFYLADPLTRVIGLYLEDIKDGRRFFDLLRAARGTKPVVILRGGRSAQGRVAAASHTGALAGGNRPWNALAQQTGAVLVETVDRFINALLALERLSLRPLRPTRSVVLFGNGGGTSVLATDAFADVGLDVSPFASLTLDALAGLALPSGTSIANPIDAPVATLQAEEGRVADRILDIVYGSAQLDALVMHINLAAFVGRGGADPIDNLLAAAVRVRAAYPDRAHFVIVLRVDGSPELDERRRRYRDAALAVGIPVYDELADAAHALGVVASIERHWGGSLACNGSPR